MKCYPSARIMIITQLCVSPKFVCSMKKFLFLIFAVLLFGSQNQLLSAMSDTPKPPIAKIIPKIDTTHKDVRTDNYFWLRDKKNPDVIKHLEEENAYSQFVMQDTKPLQEKLYNEMKSRIKESDLSVPYMDNGYFYYSKTLEGKQYAVYCRKKGSMDAKEEVIIDMNALAEGKKFLRLGRWMVSNDNKLLAYGLDYDGSRRFTMFVKNLETGEVLKDQIPEIGGAITWGNDNKTLFYNIYDASLRSYKILRHTLGYDVKSDAEIFHEKDEKFDCGVGKTRNDKYIIISTSSRTSSECWYINADKPNEMPRCIEPRKAGHEYNVDHHTDKFIILTNDKAKNFRIMETPVEKPAMSNWKQVIAHRSKVKIDDIDVFEKYFVLSCRDAGLTTLQVYDIAKKQSHNIKFPESAYFTYSSTNPDFASTSLRYGYASLITPNSIYDYDMVKREGVLLKRQEIPGGYNPDNYTVERFFVKAKDGAQVPVSLMYKKGLKKDGNNPTLLYGYGSYGISMDPTFNQQRVSLLDRGFVYAIAHIRGGGEMGKEWYENGKFLKKKNTFTDFISCAEYLIAQQYTSTPKLVIQGGSAGGLLMGAVMNMRPDLFKAVVANVPFVDVINTMLDASLPLTTGEYEEWGNPNDKKYYDYMKSYAPYENIEKKAYPNLLMTTGLNDSQVPYWEPTKFAAKLRTMKTDNNVLMMKIDMGVGHGGASGRFDALKDRAFEYAFMMKMVGITQ